MNKHHMATTVKHAFNTCRKSRTYLMFVVQPQYKTVFYNGSGINSIKITSRDVFTASVSWLPVKKQTKAFCFQ